MDFMTLNVDGGKRSCRAEVLACSAADASLLVYNRDSERVLIVRILLHHADRSGRTVACAVTAADLIRVHDTIVKAYYCMSDLDR